MLKLTKKADYGLIALKHLAVNSGGVSSSAKAIAECYGIPQPLLAKILQKLTKIGLLQSLPGTNGGYRLECVRPLDQFLWSPHVELFAEFSR